MKALENKIVFVTGGSRGIGAAIVERFAKEGASVGFSYFSNAVAAQQVLEIAAQNGTKIRAYPCDVANLEAVESTMKQFLEDFGSIDILVNNAGIIKDNLISLMPIEDWKSVLDTNLTSAYLHTHCVMKLMVAARKGVILNISSISGIRGNAGQANYAASKAGLIGFTKSIAQEVGARNIRCNAIAPGIIETEMTAEMTQHMDEKTMKNIPLRRLGRAEEVANLAVFLASDQSNYITGQVISICGGLNL